MPTQAQKVLGFLKKHRTITPREALMDLGVYRLAARIHDLRERGLKISTSNKVHPETGARYASYSLG